MRDAAFYVKVQKETNLMISREELEYKTLKIFEKKPNLTQRELAKELGVSLGRSHYVVKSLIKLGWIKLHNFRKTSHKLGYAYYLTPKGMAKKAVIATQFLSKKQEEYDKLKQEIEQLQIEIINNKNKK